MLVGLPIAVLLVALGSSSGAALRAMRKAGAADQPQPQQQQQGGAPLADAWAKDAPERLYLLHEEERLQRGVCLDGSAPAYFFRPGWGSGASKFLIHYEGGGWCTSEEACLDRAGTGYGSSRAFLNETDLSVVLKNYFSKDPASNPLFYNWNIVQLKYCDGASFAGHVERPLVVGGTPVYFRGRLINEAFIREMVRRRNLKEATDVVVSGCSAGGVAVYLHIDKWADALKGSKARVRGLADSGFFVEQSLRDCITSCNMRALVKLHKVGSGSVPSECAKAYRGEEGGPSKCFFAQYVLPYVRTPIFSTMSRFDTAAQGFNCLYGTQFTKVNELGDLVARVFNETLTQASPEHGWLLDSCTRHCYYCTGGYSKDYWNMARGPSGRSARQLFEAWYAGLGGESSWREEAAVVYPDTELCADPDPQIR